MTRLQQCEHCGRIRGADKEWRHLPGVVADVVVTCATCMIRAALREIERLKNDLNLAQGRADEEADFALRWGPADDRQRRVRALKGARQMREAKARVLRDIGKPKDGDPFAGF